MRKYNKELPTGEQLHRKAEEEARQLTAIFGENQDDSDEEECTYAYKPLKVPKKLNAEEHKN